MTKIYSKERLDKSRLLFLEPRVESGVSYAMNILEEGDMTQFLNLVAGIDSRVVHHIVTNCAKAENEEIRIDCINKAINIRVKALNRLGEALVNKCGGQMNYIEETKI